MSLSQLNAVIERIDAVKSHWSEETDIDTMRADLEGLHTSFEGVATAVVEAVDANGVAAEWVHVPEAGASKDILYLHGGGFAVCSAKSHRHFAGWLAAAAGARLLVVDYRLVPEFCFPHQLADAQSAYSWLIAQGIDPSSICVAGDSAGGGLALALIAKLKDEGEPLPACACLISAWADMLCSGDSYRSLEEVDPVASTDMAIDMGLAYVSDAIDPAHPYASPINADYSGFPPLMLQIGTRDIFLDDSRTVAARARQADVEVVLQEWPDMIHQWPMYAAVLDEAKDCLSTMGDFIKRHCEPKG
ncbi:MAG: alpha/beta hydrolase [Pseudomonadota bacterium]